MEDLENNINHHIGQILEAETNQVIVLDTVLVTLKIETKDQYVVQCKEEI